MRVVLLQKLAQLTQSKGLKIATAESCTGGGVATAITDVAGSSRWFEAGFVTYSDAAKHRLLNVPMALFSSFGAVSEQTVLAMAKGAINNSDADVSVAVSGIAGPDGGSLLKPVGTVWMAWKTGQYAESRKFQFSGDRAKVREAAIDEALHGLLAIISKYDIR